MNEKDKNTLSGADNKRLGKINCTNSEVTAAWANIKKTQEDTNVGIPDEYNVEKAKNWVDNGSKL